MPFSAFLCPLTLHYCHFSVNIFRMETIFHALSLSDKYWSDCPKRLAATKLFPASLSLFYAPLSKNMLPPEKNKRHLPALQAYVNQSPIPAKTLIVFHKIICLFEITQPPLRNPTSHQTYVNHAFPQPIAQNPYPPHTSLANSPKPNPISLPTITALCKYRLCLWEG